MKKDIMINMQSALHAKLKAEAERRGMDIKSIIIIALWKYFGLRFQE